jgi:hypothetical protein
MGTPRPEAPELLNGEVELRESLSAIRERMDLHCEGLLYALEEKVGDPLRKACSQALEAHASLLQEMAPSGKEDGSLPPNTRAVEGRRLRRYREGVRRQILEPLRESLAEIEVGRVIGERWTGFQDGLPGLADDLPEEIVRPEPEDLYGPRRDDGRLTALRKSLIRARRGLGHLLSRSGRAFLRLLGQRRPAPSPRAQRIPLKALARDHLLGPWPAALEPLGEALQQHYGSPLARLESSLTVWIDDWFPLEEGVHTAEGHLGARFLEELTRDFPAPPEPPRNDEEGDPPAVEGQDEEEGEPAPDRLANGLETACRELAAGLSAGASVPLPHPVAERLRESVEGVWENLTEEVRVAGSFQSYPAARKLGKKARRSLERGKARAAAWTRWHGSALGRLHLAILLLRLREAFDEAESSLMARIAEEALEPILTAWKEVQKGLESLERSVPTRLPVDGPSKDPKELAAEVAALLDGARSLLEDGLRTSKTEVRPVAVVRKVADEVATQLSDALRFLPESVGVHALQENPERISPTAPVRSVGFRDFVLRTVDVLRLEAIRNAPEPIRSFLKSADAEASEIPNIVSYNLTEARNELLSSGEASAGGSIADARSLTTEGLSRTRQAIDDLVLQMGEAWRSFTEEAHGLLRTTFGEIHGRAVAEGAVQEQMLGLRVAGQAWLRILLDRGRDGLSWLERRGGRVLRKAWVRGSRLVRLGRSAVGSTPTEEWEIDEALGVLRGIPDLLGSLPLVYRRLFSFQPVTDPNFLVDRETALSWVARRLEAWQDGFGAPCLISGPPGVGHSSLLNVLESTLLEELPTARLELGRRIRDETSLASLLTETFRTGGEAPRTLAEVAGRIREASAPDHPRVILVEHLEHLFLRVPGGGELWEDFITFQVQTSNRVFWLSQTYSATWKLLSKSKPRAAVLLAHLPMSYLSREAMEKLIMLRHRRSGLPVEFVQPTDLNPLVRRRLRLSRNEKARQEVLRRECFDRIFRLSEGNVSTAILHWLRSSDFTSREGWLRVTPPRPFRLVPLDETDLNLGFALKAFLEHGSLTMREFREVFATTTEEAFQVFEALRSRMLLESLDTLPGQRSGIERPEEEEPYRIPGIMSQGVARRLSTLNILH